MKTHTIRQIILSCCYCFIPALLLAQPPGFEQDTNDVPIDGGLSILLAAGIGYGIKRKFKKEDRAEKNKPATKE
jgi:hypothetical protein